MINDPDHDLRIVWFRSLDGFATQPAGAAVMKDLLRGTRSIPGVTLRQQDRWSLVTALIAYGDPEADAMFEAEKSATPAATASNTHGSPRPPTPTPPPSKNISPTTPAGLPTMRLLAPSSPLPAPAKSAKTGSSPPSSPSITGTSPNSPPRFLSPPSKPSPKSNASAKFSS